MIYIHIFLAFLRSGLLCFGGGPASIPFVHNEVVERYKWMDADEFGEVVAIGNTLPGPINTKMAGYIGYKVGGFGGLLSGLFGMVVPTAILMIVLLTTFAQFAEEPWAIGMTRALIPVVAVMIGVVGWQFLTISAKALGLPVALAHIVVVGILVGFFGLHPAIIIAGLILWAIFGMKITTLFRKGANK